MRKSPFDAKFIRKNVGLLYLIIIALSAAISANIFRNDGSILLLPMLLLTGMMIFAMSARKWFSRG